MAKKVIKGNTTGSMTMIPLDIASKITSFFLTNRTTGTIVLNLYIATTSGNIAMIPVDLNQVSGTIYVPDIGMLPIFLEKGSYLILITNGSVDYYFNIEN